MGESVNNSSLYKQKLFAAEYLKDSNATQAAIRAGYARKGAAASGRRLLKNIRVQEEMHRLRVLNKEAEQKRICPHLEQQEVLDFLTLVLRGGQGNNPFSLHSDIPMNENIVQLRERMHAAQLLGEYFHLFDKQVKNKDGFYISDCRTMEAAPGIQTIN